MNITNIVDVLIILILGLWGVIGLKRGFIKQTVMTLGTVLVFVLAFYLKNPIAEFLSLNLPFFSFGGMFKGVTSLNILLYQLISFVIVVSILQIILNIVIKISSIIETILKLTIVLGIPSKILGFILGLIEGFVVIYIALVFLSQPLFNLNIFKDSKLTSKILNNIPIISNIAGGIVDSFNDIYNLAGDYYDQNQSSNEFNLKAIDIMLDNKVISVNYVEKLNNSGKIKVTGIDKVLDEYRKEK